MRRVPSMMVKTKFTVGGEKQSWRRNLCWPFSGFQELYDFTKCGKLVPHLSFWISCFLVSFPGINLTEIQIIWMVSIIVTTFNCMKMKCVCVCVRFVVHGLTPGESYVFRVQAVNVFGLSEESQESSPIAVEPALGESNITFIFSSSSSQAKTKCFKILIKPIGSIENVWLISSLYPGRGVEYGMYEIVVFSHLTYPLLPLCPLCIMCCTELYI